MQKFVSNGHKIDTLEKGIYSQISYKIVGDPPRT